MVKQILFMAAEKLGFILEGLVERGVLSNNKNMYKKKRDSSKIELSRLSCTGGVPCSCIRLQVAA